MKIVVLNSFDFRVEVVDVPDEVVGKRQVDEYLMEEFDTLHKFSWMAAPVEYVPVTFHEHQVSYDGKSTKRSRNSKLNDFSIEECVNEIKDREKRELCEKVRQFGTRKNGFSEYRFEKDCPVVAAYCGDDPADVVILSVKVDGDDKLTITAYEKLDHSAEFYLDPDNVFAGQLNYITFSIDNYDDDEDCECGMFV